MTERSTEDPKENERFVNRLVAAIPELRPVLDEHLKDNDEVLPYVFLGAYAWPWFKSQFDSGTAEALRLCRQYIAEMETELARGDEDTSNLIRVEFLEWLMKGQGRDSMRALLPAPLARELERMDNWRPAHKRNPVMAELARLLSFAKPRKGSERES